MTNDLNMLVRRAAGRAEPFEHRAAPPIGDLGVGSGGACGPPRKQADSSTEISNRIRAGARLMRSVQLRGGLAIDLDDPWR
jgi:hypothetical protein